MMKHEHYILREFKPKLDADISIDKKYANLSVWINYADSHSEIIFDRRCADEAEALEIMNGFGHGFEYLGVCWERV